MYQLQKSLCEISQGSSSIAAYFTKIKGIWDELSSLSTISPCSCGTYAEIVKKDEEQRLIQFLMGLNPSYDNVRGNILMMQPLPAISKAYSLLTHDEKQREIHPTVQSFPDVTSMNVQAKPQENFKKSVCTHCKKSGHTINKCYRLIGFPKEFKFTKPRHAANACVNDGVDHNSSVHAMSSATSLTPDQCQQLIQFLQNTQLNNGSSQSSNNASSETNDLKYANFAGIMACSSISNSNSTWIIDTGANDHMCSNEIFFFQFKNSFQTCFHSSSKWNNNNRHKIWYN